MSLPTHAASVSVSAQHWLRAVASALPVFLWSPSLDLEHHVHRRLLLLCRRTLRHGLRRAADGVRHVEVRDLHLKKGPNRSHAFPIIYKPITLTSLLFECILFPTLVHFTLCINPSRIGLTG